MQWRITRARTIRGVSWVLANQVPVRRERHEQSFFLSCLHRHYKRGGYGGGGGRGNLGHVLPPPQFHGLPAVKTRSLAVEEAQFDEFVVGVSLGGEEAVHVLHGLQLEAGQL